VGLALVKKEDKMSYLQDCKYSYGSMYGCINEPIVEEEFGYPYRYPYYPMFYRFHRYIPRRRLWGGW